MTQAFDRLKNCLDDVKNGLSENKLELSLDKTKFIVVGSKMQCGKLGNFFTVNIISNSSLLLSQTGT